MEHDPLDRAVRDLRRVRLLHAILLLIGLGILALAAWTTSR